MKKIKSIKQLQAEKKRIKQKQEAIENQIRVSWKELKETLQPVNMAKDAIGSIFRKTPTENINQNSLLKTVFNFGLTLLAGKLTEKAGERLRKIFSKSSA
jgi:hypothetical protein